jgi:ribosome-binding ATPase YchF (GTP1/OBG family)
LQSNFNKKQLNLSGLLSLKPKIFVCNVDEQSVQNGNKYTEKFIDKFGQENTLVVSADIENQINELEMNEKKKLYGNDWFKKYWIRYVNSKGL